MKEKIIEEVLQQMLPYLDNSQERRLEEVLKYTLFGCEIHCTEDIGTERNNTWLLDQFIVSKRIEGCSEKTLCYYQNTVTDMMAAIVKDVVHITTDDLRNYLTFFQGEHKLSLITVDNVRRILSSFFSWLEDEDYILKSPVRRIHKVKTASNVKETFTDEALETMRDNCDELRDLALIDILASTGMRVGELVLLNREVSILMSVNV